MADHDNGYKLLFTHPRMVEDLLRGYVDEDWVAELDFSSLERVGGSSVSDDFRERHNDMIWRVSRRREEGGDRHLYLLLEFQSTADPFMTVRVMGYMAMLLEELIRHKRLAPGRKLPPVIGLVLYCGRPRWRDPLSLAALFAPVSGGLAAHLPRLDCLLLDERRLSARGTGLAGNLVAVLFRLEAVSSPRELTRLIALLAAWLPRDEEPGLRRAFTVWLLRRVRRSFPGITIDGITDLEDFPMLEEWRDRILREGAREGRREGRRQGQVEGMQRVVIRLLEARFGRLSALARRQVRALTSEEELEALAKRLLGAGSLRELGLE